MILRVHDKVILQRYIENEMKQANFLLDKNYVQISDEILLFAYFAGHGCADTMQYFVLNETTVQKCFWKAEGNLQRLATMAGKNLKSFVVFDTCREPLEIPL